MVLVLDAGGAPILRVVSGPDTFDFALRMGVIATMLQGFGRVFGALLDRAEAAEKCREIEGRSLS
jgi:hypothetical protein